MFEKSVDTYTVKEACRERDCRRDNSTHYIIHLQIWDSVACSPNGEDDF